MARRLVGLCALLGALSACATIVGIEDTTVTRGSDDGHGSSAGSAGAGVAQAGTSNPSQSNGDRAPGGGAPSAGAESGGAGP